MTKIQKNYRVHIYQNGDPTTVDFTVPLSSPPDLPLGPVIRPSNITSEGSSGSISVVDENRLITNNLASAGKMNWIGRRVVIQRQVNGGAWDDLFGGRVISLSLGRELDTWNIGLSDEAYQLRVSNIFESVGPNPTTSLIPAGLKWVWGVNRSTASFGAIFEEGFDAIIGHTPMMLVSPYAIPQSVIDYILNDYNFEEGKWDTLELVIDGANFSGTVTDFSFDLTDVDHPDHEQRLVGDIQELDDGDPLDSPQVPITIHESGVDITTGDRAYLHAPNAEPTEDYPLHTGVEDAIGPDVLPTIGSDAHGPVPANVAYQSRNPIRILEEIFDYFGLQYNQTNIDEFADKFDSYEFNFRVTSPQPAGSWLDENILIPLGILISTDGSGIINLREFRLPDPSDVDVNNLPTFNHSNVREPYPTFDHTEAEAVTDINFHIYRYVPTRTKSSISENAEELAADLVREETFTKERHHEPEANVIRREMDVHLRGVSYRSRVARRAGTERTDPNPTVTSLMERVAFETFSKFGEGVIKSTLNGTHDVFDMGIRPGDIIRYDLDFYPNPSDNDRGQSRLFHVLQPKYDVRGPSFEFVDLGPALNPMASPTLTLSSNSENPRNRVDWSVTDIIPGSGILLEISYEDDQSWFPVLSIGPSQVLAAGGTSISGTFMEQPSNTTMYARVRQIQHGRIPSNWNVAGPHTTDSITPPTNLSATVNGSVVAIDWENTTSYHPMPVLDGNDASALPLPKSSNNFVYTGLASNTGYTVGVKYVDQFGGESAAVTTSVTTGQALFLRPPRRVILRQGRASPSDPYPPEQYTTGYGLEVHFFPKEPSAFTIVQVSTNLDFTEIENEFELDPGQDSTFIITPADNKKRFIRLAHNKEGFDQSTWSPIVSGYPTRLVPDRTDLTEFATGIAFLSLTRDEEVEFTVDHGGDPDTDRAYYEWELNPDEESPYPDVHEEDDPGEGIEASPFVEREDMLYREILTDDQDQPIVLGDNDVVYMTVRFWNESMGFGQTTRIRFSRADIESQFPEPELIAEIEYFSEQTNGEIDKFARVILEVKDPFGRLVETDPIRAFAEEGPIDALPPVDQYTPKAPEASGEHEGKYVWEVPLNEKHFSVVAIAAHWLDFQQNEKTVQKILWLDIGDEANIVYIDITYDSGVATVRIKGDADTQSLHIEELDGATWTGVFETDPLTDEEGTTHQGAWDENTSYSFQQSVTYEGIVYWWTDDTNNSTTGTPPTNEAGWDHATRISDNRRGEFKVDVQESERTLRVRGKNPKDEFGPWEEFGIDAEIDVPPADESDVEIQNVSWIVGSTFDFRYIRVMAWIDDSVQSVRFFHDAAEAPTGDDLSDNFLLTRTEISPDADGNFTIRMKDEQGNLVDYPYDYGSDIRVRLVAYDNVEGTDPVHDISQVVILLDEASLFNGAQTYISSELSIASNSLNIGEGIKLESTSAPSISLDLSDRIIAVSEGGTGLDAVPEGSLLVGSGIDSLSTLTHPAPGSSPRYLEATGSLSDPQYAWVESVEGAGGVTGGAGISVVDNTVSIDNYAGFDAGLGHLVFENGQVAVSLGTGQNDAAAGNHLHSNISVNSGDGMTGGGALNTNRTLNVGAGDGINTSSTSVSVDSSVVRTTRSVSAGSGLSGGGTLSSDVTINMATPSQVNAASSNSVTASSHTHELAGNIGRVTVSGSAPSGSPSRVGDIHFVI